MTTRFRDRHDAGRFLAERLADYSGRPDVLVLALPRGGVPVGFEIARALGVPLDVFLVRKLGVPGHEELAMGAIAAGGVRVVNTDVVASLGIPAAVIEAVTAAEERELLRRQQLYRDDRPLPDLQGRTAILVDDGLATGATMQAAVAAVRAQHPARLIVAVPTAAPQTCAAFAGVVDAIVCGITPEPFYAVGLWYDDFSPTTDAEVRDLLGRDMLVQIPTEAGVLEGTLSVPAGARGVVLFAHGSGSSRHSPRNRYVAEMLQAAGLATLLMDLLTAAEEQADLQTAALRFDIGLLAERLAEATDWLAEQPATARLSVGYFGASTGGGAALVAAATRPDAVGAVVSRGGRPDLAGPALPRVQAPTLLIVGGLDAVVIGLNEAARAQMRAPTHLEIVPGASHLFAEPGTLEAVARLARDWFVRYLDAAPAPE